MQHFCVTDNSATSPVIVHAPHGGRLIPEEHRSAYVVSAAALEAEKDVMTDHFTDLLIRGLVGASSMVNELSRLSVDVERFANDSEEMNAAGMGVLYTHGSRGQHIRDLAQADRPALMRHFDDYSAAFTDLVNGTLSRHGRAVIIDVHSYPEHALPYELHAEQPRPELCLGYETFHASAESVRTVMEAFDHLQILANVPFAGAYVPLAHHKTDTRVQSVMLEIRRDVYINQSTLKVQPEPFRALQHSLQHLVNALTGQSDSVAR